MARRPLLPSFAGPARRARWWRGVARRVLAACCAVGAVLALWAALHPPPPPTRAVVVASRELAGGHTLSQADLAEVDRPVDGLAPGLVPGAAAVGRVLATPLRAGEVLTDTRLVPRGPADGLPAGEVVLHVVVADPRALGLVSPGSAVRVHAATGGAVLARSARVLGLDPEPARGSDLLAPPTQEGDRGVFLALDGAAAERVLASRADSSGPPAVLLVGLGVR